MSTRASSWKATPSIVVEDVDHRQSKLFNLKYPDRNSNCRPSLHEKHSCTSVIEMQTVVGTIKPDVDAYVTPLSLCPSPTTSKQGSPSSAPYRATEVIPLKSCEYVFIFSLMIKMRFTLFTAEWCSCSWTCSYASRFGIEWQLHFGRHRRTRQRSRKCELVE